MRDELTVTVSGRTVYDRSLDELTETISSWGEPAFRARQIHSQLWRRAATYDRMSEISPALRERLASVPDRWHLYQVMK